MATKDKATKVAENPEDRCSFEGCVRAKLAHGLCWSHYQQERRHRPLTPIRRRGLKPLPGNVRVGPEVEEVLRLWLNTGVVPSMYEATRKAVALGVESWLRAQKIKATKAAKAAPKVETPAATPAPVAKAT
jgi:hypothetical protein